MDKIQKITNILKLINGRVCITVTCSIGFILIINCICEIIIKNADKLTFDNISYLLNIVILVISNVITFYFSNRDKGK